MFTKVCTMCKLDKPHKEFYNSKASRDGKSYRCKSCDRVQGLLYRKKHLKRDKSNRKWERRRRVYGLSKADFKSLLESQKGLCAICDSVLKEGTNRDRNSLVIDHCHETGEVRGLLCTTCNKGIGLLGDTEVAIQKALDYISRRNK